MQKQSLKAVLTDDSLASIPMGGISLPRLPAIAVSVDDVIIALEKTESFLHTNTPVTKTQNPLLNAVLSFGSVSETYIKAGLSLVLDPLLASTRAAVWGGYQYNDQVNAAGSHWQARGLGNFSVADAWKGLEFSFMDYKYFNKLMFGAATIAVAGIALEISNYVNNLMQNGGGHSQHTEIGFGSPSGDNKASGTLFPTITDRSCQLKYLGSSIGVDCGPREIYDLSHFPQMQVVVSGSKGIYYAQPSLVGIGENASIQYSTSASLPLNQGVNTVTLSFPSNPQYVPNIGSASFGHCSVNSGIGTNTLNIYCPATGSESMTLGLKADGISFGYVGHGNVLPVIQPTPAVTPHKNGTGTDSGTGTGTNPSPTECPPWGCNGE